MTNLFPDFENRLRKFMRGDSSHAFEKLALELFQLQYEHVAPYRNFCDARKISPDNIRDWREIPAVPTGAFKEFDLTALAPHERTIVFHSSGTTQQKPSRHFHNYQSLDLYEASLLSWKGLPSTGCKY